jgi:hypothetical protein
MLILQRRPLMQMALAGRRLVKVEDMISGWLNDFQGFLEIQSINLLNFLDNKSIAGILQVLIGAGLLGSWSRKRDDQKARQDEIIRFVNDTADLLNGSLSKLFGCIRRSNFSDLSGLNESTGALFEKRMSIRVRSRVLLDSEEFSRELDILIWQISHCRDAIHNYGLSKNNEAIQQLIHEKINNLSALDHIKISTNTKLESPWNDLLLWAECIWQHSDYLLSRVLEVALSNEKHFNLPANQRLQRNGRTD